MLKRRAGGQPRATRAARCRLGGRRGRAVILAAIAVPAVAALDACEVGERAGAGLDEVFREPEDAEHALEHGALQLSGASARARFAAGPVAVPVERPFRQASFSYAMPGESIIEARVERLDGTWTDWAPIEETWREEDRRVARLRLRAAAKGLELRAGAAPTELFVALSETVLGRDDRLTRDLPFEQESFAAEALPEDGVGEARLAIAPADLVIPRVDWKARDPNKICGDVVAPYRASIHHTYEPADDGGDAAARMRQIQAFHIDTNGWCDIGYHFVVSQAGKIYQGRSDERRPAAHVANQNSGNVGICLIGDFMKNPPKSAQFEAASRILAWVTTTYDIPLEPSAVKGHRQWPGQSTSCPGDALVGKLGELMQLAKAAAGNPGTGAKAEVSLSAKVRGGDDFCATGSSAGVADALPGDRVEVQVIVKNGTASALKDVTLGVDYDGEHLSATDYSIETDHPAKDQSTWTINDADSAPENPPKDALASGSTLALYALGAGESKRVTVTLEATRYSFGLARSGLRTWIKTIDGLYEQDSFGEKPSVNSTSHVLEGEARIDVQSDRGWRFDGPDEADTEGFGPCEPGGQAPGAGSGALTGESSACFASPSWTSIDADKFDEAVLRVDVKGGGPALFELGARAGGAHVDSVRFEAPAGKSSLVVPLAERAEWKGTVDALELAVVDGASDGFAIDVLFFQSSAEKKTSLAGEPYDDGEKVALDEARDGANTKDGSAMNALPPSGCTCEIAGTGAGHDSGCALVAALAGLAMALGRRRREPSN